MTPHHPEDEVVAAEAVDVGSLLNENKELQEENRQLKDRLLRALADAENARRQADRATKEASQYAISEFARELLTVVDNLERTIEAARKEAPGSIGTQALLEGAQATLRSFIRTLERFKVRPIDAKGKQFDPNLHEAIGTVPDSSKPAGTVAEVAQPGYRIHDRLLRPAQVVVSTSSDKAPVAEPSEESNDDLGRLWGA